MTDEHQDLWATVDHYFYEALIPSNEALTAALHDNAAAGFPAHDVAPNQGKLLCLLAQVQGARRILEIGTLGGYSTIWLARALPPDGRLVTLEVDEAWASVARGNIARAGLHDVVEVRVGRAVDSLATLAEEGRGRSTSSSSTRTSRATRRTWRGPAPLHARHAGADAERLRAAPPE